MQADAYMLQEAFDIAQFARFGAGNQTLTHKIAPVVAKVGSTGDPAEHLQITQAARAFLAVGFERVGGVLAVRMAAALLERFGLEKGAGVERLAVARMPILEQGRIAANQTRFEQIGLDRDVVAREGETFFDRARAEADLKTDIP